MYYESDTVKSDCSVQIFRKMINSQNLIQTVGLSITSFTVSGDKKKL